MHLVTLITAIIAVLTISFASAAVDCNGECKPTGGWWVGNEPNPSAFESIECGDCYPGCPETALCQIYNGGVCNWGHCRLGKDCCEPLLGYHIEPPFYCWWIKGHRLTREECQNVVNGKASS